jgi:DNA-binding NarL/FixJ family response regulator
VDFLPPSWQYADHTCAEIIFDGQFFLSRNFRKTKWRQSVPINLNGRQFGECIIYYTEEFPEADEGPFLKEERALLNAVADRIGSIAARISADRELEEANEQLKLERQALRETNTALKVILSRNEQQKNDIRRDINHNMEKAVLPIIDSLRVHLSSAHQKYVALLKTNLEELTSPFMSGLAAGFPSLSPTELLICNMIKNGLTSGEIAETRGVALSTVNHHREKIRRKLGIANREVNLATFLQNNAVEAE